MSTTMLYRASDAPNSEVWDLKVEHKVFADDDVPAALEEGWALHPNDVQQPEAKAEGGKRGAKAGEQ